MAPRLRSIRARTLLPQGLAVDLSDLAAGGTHGYVAVGADRLEVSESVCSSSILRDPLIATTCDDEILR